MGAVVVVVDMMVLIVRHVNIISVYNVVVLVVRIYALILILIVQILVRVSVVSCWITIARIYTVWRRVGRRYSNRTGKRLNVEIVHVAVAVAVDTICSRIFVFLFCEVVVGKLKVEHV